MDIYKIIRFIIAIVAGAFVGGLFMLAIQSIAQIIWPLPYFFDPFDKDIFRKLNTSESVFILLPYLTAFFTGSLVGGFFAGILSRGKSPNASLIVGALLMTYGLISLSSIHYPLWFTILALCTFLPPAWLGSSLAGKAKKL
jgi:hypothetical protein